MNDLTAEFWLISVPILLLGMVLGALIVYAIVRPKPGQKTVSEVEAEFDDYKTQVAEHFSKTSEIFKDLTENYRGLYEHMAAGATSLCDAETVGTALELARSGLLSHADEQAAARQEQNNADKSVPSESDQAPDVDTPPTPNAASEATLTVPAASDASAPSPLPKPAN